MHLRIVHTRSGGKARRYAQLVESFRRDDGMPAHKIIASLGALSDREIENLRTALRASREGASVVLPAETRAEDWEVRISANRRYLDVAVALAMWRYWKLTELFNRLLPGRTEHVPTSLVVAALVLHRCIAPGSKLYAQRWFPTTALPELLNVDPERFNNSRIHRALEELDHVDGRLQEELPMRYQQRDGAFAALFLDVTDTYFQGRGCELAQRDRTKEGLRNVHKIGIVLLCTERGYPLRWHVVAGKRRDPDCMRAMVAQIERLNWIGQTPLVCDRAMGNGRSVARLLAGGLRFLTAATVLEIGSYTDELPGEAFDELAPEGLERTLEAEVEAAGRAALNAGLEKVDELLYVRDLGVHKRVLKLEREPVETAEFEIDPAAHEGGAAFLALARVFEGRLQRGEVKNQSTLAEREGLSRARVTQILNLLKLDEQLQDELLRGDFGHVPERLLRRAITQTSAAAQRRILEDHADRARPYRKGAKKLRFVRTGRQEAALRLATYFNPKMFVEQRTRAIQRRRKIETWVAALNKQLRLSKRERDAVYLEVVNKLKGNNLLGVYEMRIEKIPFGKGQAHLEVRLCPDEVEWKRRRRFDGFVLLVGHPELPQSAAELARLYRAKEAIEKDFRTIKEAIKLRPVFHHTDPKVRAHVTLCMLALLLERTLEERLHRSSLPMTASACFELLAGCHLNAVRSSPDVLPYHQLTEPTQDQRAILRVLRLNDLIDPEVVQVRIHPRNAG